MNTKWKPENSESILLADSQNPAVHTALHCTVTCFATCSFHNWEGIFLVNWIFNYLSCLMLGCEKVWSLLHC